MHRSESILWLNGLLLIGRLYLLFYRKQVLSEEKAVVGLTKAKLTLRHVDVLDTSSQKLLLEHLLLLFVNLKLKFLIIGQSS